MPGQRRSPRARANGSWLPRLAGLSAVVVLAAGAVTGYLIAFHPGAAHHPPPLPTQVVSDQTVGLVVGHTKPGSAAGQLLQLVSSHGTPVFSPVSPAELVQGSPEWTADLMTGDTYIFIYLPTGQCLAATGPASRRTLALAHCDLNANQRWRRTQQAVTSEAHAFFQYANFADADCLTQRGELSGTVFGAALATCSPTAPASQLVAFWWSAV
jgi:hypothetical protein